MRWIYVVAPQGAAGQHILLRDWSPLVMSNDIEDVAKCLAANGVASLEYLHEGKLYSIPAHWIEAREPINERLSGPPL